MFCVFLRGRSTLESVVGKYGVLQHIYDIILIFKRKLKTTVHISGRSCGSGVVLSTFHLRDGKQRFRSQAEPKVY